MNLFLRILLPALILTLLNGVNPMTSDDPAYYSHAQQFAEAPLRPYSGELWYAKRLGPSIENVAPPVLPYWMALGMKVVGEEPFLLKFWLFPFAAILAWALHDLLRRFASGVEMPLLWLTTLSPAILPSFCFMLDVPALALGLLAIAVFLRAADNSSVRLAILSGLVAGLAVQTKFNAVSASVTIFICGLIFGRQRLALLAVLVAAGVFVAWEGFVYSLHGTSQFFVLRGRDSHFHVTSMWHLLKSLLRMNGQVAAALVPLGVLAMGGRPWKTTVTVLAVAVAFGLLAVIPGELGWYLTMLWLGPALFATVAMAAWHLRKDCQMRFLLAWLGVEVVVFFLLSPHSAVRRFLCLIVVMTLVLGRRFAMNAPTARVLLRGITAFGVTLGLTVWMAGFMDGLQEQSVVSRALADVRKQGAHGTVWYLADNWKYLQYGAPRAGLAPVLPGRSLLKAGDWLVRDYDPNIEEHGIDRSMVEVAGVYHDMSPFPLCNQPDYFGGKFPVQRRSSSRVIGALYRVRNDFIPQVRSQPRE